MEGTSKQRKMTDRGETERGAGQETSHGRAENGAEQGQALRKCSADRKLLGEGVAGQGKCHDRGRQKIERIDHGRTRYKLG